MKKVAKTQEYLNCIFFLNQDYSGFLASDSSIPGDCPFVEISHSSFNRCVCPHLLFAGGEEEAPKQLRTLASNGKR